MLILLDNGHGHNTPGKQSPCGTFREYQFTRLLSAEIHNRLLSLGIENRLITPETNDISLHTRVQRVNAICRQHPSQSVLLISLHCNAASCGQWSSARGWSVYVGKNASSRSRQAAAIIASQARLKGLHVLQPHPTTPYWTQSLAMLRDTICPAILTENLFMDNRDDLELLKAPDTLRLLTQIHVNAIIALTSS